jgi:hypothetical protein
MGLLLFYQYSYLHFIIGFISARFLYNYSYMNKWFEKHIK